MLPIILKTNITDHFTSILQIAFPKNNGVHTAKRVKHFVNKDKLHDMPVYI